MTPVAKEGKQQTCHGVRDEHRCGSEREEHAEEQRGPRVSPEAGGWAGKRRVRRHQKACSAPLLQIETFNLNVSIQFLCFRI